MIVEKQKETERRSMEANEQYSRENNIKFTNVTEAEGEDKESN